MLENQGYSANVRKNGKEAVGGKNYLAHFDLKTRSVLYSCPCRAVDGLFGEGAMAFLPEASYGTTWWYKRLQLNRDLWLRNHFGYSPVASMQSISYTCSKAPELCLVFLPVKVPISTCKVVGRETRSENHLKGLNTPGDIWRSQTQLDSQDLNAITFYF